MLKLKELINKIDSYFTNVEIYSEDYKKIKVLENVLSYELREIEDYSVFGLDTTFKTHIISKNGVEVKTILIIKIINE